MKYLLTDNNTESRRYSQI